MSSRREMVLPEPGLAVGLRLPEPRLAVGLRLPEPGRWGTADTDVQMVREAARL